MRSVLSFTLVAALSVACSNGGTSSGGGGSSGSGAQGGSAGTGATAGTGGTSGGGGAAGNGGNSGTGGVGTSCADLGGSCQCAGGCPSGFHSAGELDCPQPCANCGACSQWCCAPDAQDAGTD